MANTIYTQTLQADVGFPTKPAVNSSLTIILQGGASQDEQHNSALLHAAVTTLKNINEALIIYLAKNMQSVGLLVQASSHA